MEKVLASHDPTGRDAPPGALVGEDHTSPFSRSRKFPATPRHVSGAAERTFSAISLEISVRSEQESGATATSRVRVPSAVRTGQTPRQRRGFPRFAANMYVSGSRRGRARPCGSTRSRARSWFGGTARAPSRPGRSSPCSAAWGCRRPRSRSRSRPNRWTLRSARSARSARGHRSAG